MKKVIFYHVATKCHNAARMTIKIKDKIVETTIWSSEKPELKKKIYSYFTRRKAYRQFKIFIAEALLGGWNVLTVFPNEDEGD